MLYCSLHRTVKIISLQRVAATVTSCDFICMVQVYSS